MMKRTFSIKGFLGMMLVIALMAGALPAQAARFETIRPGDQGEDVRQMQRALDFLGFALKDDGKYGSMTIQAVQLFQARMRLKQDGLAGDRTLSALYDLAPQFEPGQQGSDQVPRQTVDASQAESAASYDSATVVTPNQGSLNLRRTAARGQNTFYQIPHGTVVRVLAVSGQWVRVEAHGRIGYVQQDYLRPGSVAVPVVTAQPVTTPAPQAPLTPPEPRPAASGTAQVITANRGSLNLRRTAAYGANTFYQIPYATVVNVLGTSGQWTQVETGGRRGYVVSSFLQPVGSSPLATPSHTAAPEETALPAGSENAATAVVYTQNGGSLNLRAQARTGNNAIASIPFGSDVRVLSQGSPWSQVAFNGRTGWVMSSFLRFGQAAPEPTPEPAAPLPEAPPAAPEPAPLFPRILRAGASGEDVLLMQERLKALGYACPVTGTFDEPTLAAFRHFQTLNGLTADGVLGSQSAVVLLSEAARGADSAPLSYTALSLDSVDGADKQVSALQKALNELGYLVSVNGRYDVTTHQAVVAFQQINGISPTGIASAVTQSTLFSGKAKRFNPSAVTVDTGGSGGGPSSGQVRLLHWYEDVKKSASTGQQLSVYHPGSGISFKLRIYSMGAHADSEPLTLRDTQLMNKAFGAPSWNINVVYVKLPDGRWTMASMHNRPHLSGNIKDNGFDGHLCVHFLRDLDEVTRNDPNYGLSNQKAIRTAWQRLSGETLSK